MLLLIDRHLILYVLIGLFGVVVDFGSFYIINVLFPGHYLVANTIGCCLGMLNNFILNYKVNFKVSGHLLRRCLLFFGIGVSGVFVSNAVIALLVEKASLSPAPSKVIALVIVVAAQYTVNRCITFRA